MEGGNRSGVHDAIRHGDLHMQAAWRLAVFGNIPPPPDPDLPDHYAQRGLVPRAGPPLTYRQGRFWILRGIST